MGSRASDKKHCAREVGFETVNIVCHTGTAPAIQQLQEGQDYAANMSAEGNYFCHVKTCSDSGTAKFFCLKRRRMFQWHQDLVRGVPDVQVLCPQ